MTGAIGADVDQLRSLAKQFTQSADRLEQTSSGLGRIIGAAAYWRGNDANQFRAQWRSQSTPSITAAVKTLRTAAEALAHNADEQDQASAADRSRPSTTSNPARTSRYKPPDDDFSLSKIFDLSKNMDANSTGYRIQEIQGEDGETRYIVYIKGTDPLNHGTQNDYSNIAAYTGEPDTELAELRRRIGDHEVMMVGYSQGGMDAQNIAALGGYAGGGLNVTNVVTFGSPVRKDLDIPAIHLATSDDPIASITGTLWRATNSYEAPNTDFVKRAGFWDGFQDAFGIGAHVNDYPDVANTFDENAAISNSREAIAFNRLADFRGTVVDSRTLY